MAPQQFDENTRAAISLALESLRSRDFDTVLHVITAVLIRPNGQPFIVLNPRVNPIAYMIQLKPFIPTIDDYRAEFAEFLKWFGDRLEEARLERERELARERDDEDGDEEE